MTAQSTKVVRRSAWDETPALLLRDPPKDSRRLGAGDWWEPATFFRTLCAFAEVLL